MTTPTHGYRKLVAEARATANTVRSPDLADLLRGLADAVDDLDQQAALLSDAVKRAEGVPIDN